MPVMIFVSIIVILGFLVPVACILLALAMPPPENPVAYVRARRRGKRAGTERIVFIGDSITHGNASANFVAMVETMLGAGGGTRDIINAGRNGNTTVHVLSRLSSILACKPTIAIVLIGTNDAKNSLNARSRIKDPAARETMLGEDLATFTANLNRLVHALQEAGTHRVGLVSLPPIGERLDDAAFQLSTRYAGATRDVARATSVAYIPVHESMVDHIKANPRSLRYAYKHWFPVMLGAIIARRYLRRSYHAIGRWNGFSLHSDHLHMNETGARVIARLVAGFLEPG